MKKTSGLIIIIIGVAVLLGIILIFVNKEISPDSQASQTYKSNEADYKIIYPSSLTVEKSILEENEEEGLEGFNEEAKREKENEENKNLFEKLFEKERDAEYLTFDDPDENIYEITMVVVPDPTEPSQMPEFFERIAPYTTPAPQKVRYGQIEGYQTIRKVVVVGVKNHSIINFILSDKEKGYYMEFNIEYNDAHPAAREKALNITKQILSSFEYT